MYVKIIDRTSSAEKPDETVIECEKILKRFINGPEKEVELVIIQKSRYPEEKQAEGQYSACNVSELRWPLGAGVVVFLMNDAGKTIDTWTI
jgi:hypothetical protein